MRSGVSPSMRSPRYRIAPASGTSAPAIRLNKVVLPAPLGPMSPVMVPASTVKLTPSTARRLPNALTSSATSSMRPDYGKRGGLRGRDREQGPVAGHALEHVTAAIVEPDAGARDEIPNGSRDQHFLRSRRRRDSGAGVHGDAAHPGSLHLTFAGVKARPHLEAEALDRVANRTR